MMVRDMEIITLKVPDVVTAIGMLRASLKRERFLLDKSIVDTKKKLEVFEEKNRMRSEGFFDKFDKGLAGDDQDTMLWAAEYEALKLLGHERSIIERMLSQCK
uniref:Uncharacterized protein n=1 Tax=uncultured Methanosarcinales archaeon TaxID=183757 RepID=A0A7H1KNL2_9EURY|nr:hypothetical protein NCGJLENL_00010 [uncultured Methanosarcinales archaeon]